MTQADTDVAGKRPLSPHLTVYKPMLTMMMSIAHRISGVALYLGAFLLALYLLGLAFGREFSAPSPGSPTLYRHVIVLGFSWALFHHLLGGVRHALWDRGLYMDPRAANCSRRRRSAAESS